MKLKSKFFNADWWNTRLALIIRDEENFAEKHRIPYTPLRLGLLAFFAFLLIFILGFNVASFFMPRQKFGGNDGEITRQVVALNLTVDSLAEVLEKKNTYIESFRKSFGEDVKHLKDEDKIAKTKTKNTKKGDSVNIDRLDKSDVKLREEMEKGNVILTGTSKVENLKDLYLFAPSKGIVTDKYSSLNQHYGVDIVAEKDAPIKSVAEGTVIMASWTDDTGYVITVQHKAELISVYKHCSVLLKKPGDFVRAGEIIAIIGNTGELTSGPHLHFELWYQGNPINPEKLISF